MLSAFWHTLFADPIYNALVFFIDVVPGGDVGLAIILTTLLVKLVLLPLSLRAARTQLVMRELEPQLKKVQEKFKNKREEMARATMDAYKKAGVNPFSSIVLLLIQIPIVIALYLAVSGRGGMSLPQVNVDLLYSFVPTPEQVSMFLFGFVDIVGRNLPLAAIAGLTQYIQTALVLPKPKPREKNAEPNFKDDFARSMHVQMRYVMPVIIFVVAYTISAAIALYFTVSNIFAIAQEYYIRHRGLRHNGE